MGIMAEVVILFTLSN